MNNKTNTLRKEETRPVTEAETLDRVTREVSEDARKRPEAYLDDTNVPAGGE